MKVFAGIRSKRSRALIAIAAVVAVGAGIGPPWAAKAAAPTLQVTPDLANSSQGASGRELTAITTDAVGLQVHFEVVSGPGEPATGGGAAGDTPLQPDYRCTVAADNRCAITIASATVGTTLVRAWVNADGADATADADSAEGRLADKSVAAGIGGTDCETEGAVGSSGRSACETGLPVAGAVTEPDLTDVVQLTFVQAPTKLDCDVRGTDADDVNVDDTTSVNFQDGVPVKCTAYNPQSAPVPGVRVDGENLGTVNNPETGAQADPADYFTRSDPITGEKTVIDFCVTDATGSCSNSVPASKAQQGTTDVCFWIDGDNDYGDGGDDVSFAPAGSASDGGGCAAEPWDEAEKNDVSDTNRVTWDNTTSPTTTTTTTAPTTTTTSTSTTSTTAPTTSTTSTTSTSTTTTTIPVTTSPRITTGPGPGGGPHIKVFSASGGDLGPGFFDGNESSGKRVARGDLDGDGRDEIITGSGPNSAAVVSAYSPTGTLVASSFAYNNGSFFGGVFVAAGDLNGDGRDEIITGAGPGGGPHVRVWSLSGPSTLTGSTGFFAYSSAFAGGVAVGAGDVNGDDKADILTGAGAGGGPHVKAFSGANLATELLSFYAYDPNFQGGVTVAAGDLDGLVDGKAEIITGVLPGGGPHLRLFNSDGTLRNNGIFTGPAGFAGGVTVAAGDLDGDGKAEIVVGPFTGTNRVKGYKADLTPFGAPLDFAPYGTFAGGNFVAIGQA